MITWYPELLPILCDTCLMHNWKESLNIYSCVTKNTIGYTNNPVVLEYRNCPEKLWKTLLEIRKEMLKR